ncbi:folylpolyglutamate synthase/dihydrofolate synthase family protein [soil metagenome]
MVATRTFEQVCDELDRRRHVTLGLERIQSLLDLLGHPEESLRVVQVVGTNGKGTTAVALAAALQEAGLAAGTYLSPHVLSYTERMMIRGDYVSEEQFAGVMDRVMEAADEGGVPASQFELLTAGALRLFHEANVEWAVMEAGLGARYDATTAAKPEAVVLTNVGLDHTEYLGNTFGKIAREKLASLPGGGILIVGDENPEIVGIAREECKRAGTRLVEADSSPNYGLSDRTVSFAGRNVLLGVRAAEELLDRPFGPQVRERVARQVEGVLPGRFEVYELDGIPVIVDGGHNPGGLEVALAGVRETYGDRPLGIVFGVLRDKDIGSMLTALETEASHLVLTRPDNERAAAPEWVVEHYGPRDLEDRLAEVTVDVSEAVDGAVSEMKRTNGVVLVTGSLYTGAAVLRRLRES